MPKIPNPTFIAMSVLICAAFVSFILWYILMQKSSKIALCIVAREGSKALWDHFLPFVDNYDVFVVTDTPFDTTGLDSRIRHVYIDNKTCELHGYTGSCIATIPKPIVSWDRALCYFTCLVDHPYEHVWFIEDDCLIPRPETLVRLDTKFPRFDLLCRDNNSQVSNREWMHWPEVTRVLGPKDLHHSLVCICRSSKELLKRIGQDIQHRRQVGFIEGLFTTIAKRNELSVQTVEEFETITWEPRYWESLQRNQVDWKCVYHPIKQMNHMCRLLGCAQH